MDMTMPHPESSRHDLEKSVHVAALDGLAG